MECNRMVCRIRKLNGLEQYVMKWDSLDGLPKHGIIAKVFAKNKYSH